MKWEIKGYSEMSDIFMLSLDMLSNYFSRILCDELFILSEEVYL